MLTLLNINLAFSADNITPVDPANVQPAKSDEDVQQLSLSSEGNRRKLSSQLTVAFLGREYIGSKPLTFSAGLFVHKGDILTLRYSILNGHNSDSAQKLRAVTLGYRSFVGNSFNFMPSVYYRRNTASYNKTVFTNGDGKLIYEDVGLGIRFGNEWQWENFTLGCDWLGINHTVKEINKFERSLGVFDSVNFDKETTLTYLSFYMGFSF